MRVRIRLEVVVGVVFAALLAAGPGIANGAAWLPPVPLNNAVTSVPSVAVDAAGDTLATWNTPTPGAIQASHRLAGSAGFAQLPDLSATLGAGFDNTGAVVASNRNGDAIVAWVHQSDNSGDHTIEIASVAPSGATTSLVTALTSGSVSNVAAAIGGGGDAVVAWLKSGGGIQAVTRQGLGGSFSNLVTPDTLNPLGAGQPSAAIDSAGNAIVAYQVTTAPTSIGASRHAAGAGAWASGDAITPSGGHSFSDPDVAANPAGQMVVAFSDMLGTAAAAAVRGTVSAGWGVSPTVGTLSNSPVSHGPLATINDAGNAVVGWSTSSAVQFAQVGPTGAFPSPATAQSITTDTPDDFALAGNGRGDAIAAWYAFDTTVNVVRAVVKPSTSSSFGNPQIVSSTTVFSSLPVIGLDELGDGVVPYQLGATPNGVAAAIFDGAPPRLGTVSKPANVQAGKAAAFSATATDAFSAVTLRWSFGDGSAATAGGSVTHRYARGGRFTVTLTATDAAANSAGATFTVTVASAPPPPPPKCVVPKLAGKTLSQARTALSRAHCKLGKVHQPKKPKHRRLRKLIVKSSSPGRGAVRANGAKVAVTLVEVPKPKPTKHKK
jgi:PKD domain